MAARTAGRKGSRKFLEMTLGLLGMAAMAAILPAATPAVSADATPAAKTPSLEGTWILNEDLTARMRESDQQKGSKHSGGGRHGGGGRRGGGPVPEPGSDPDDGPFGAPGSSPTNPNGGFPDILGGDPQFPDGPRPSFNALTQVKITQKGQQVTIADSEGHTRVLTTDGSKVKDPKAAGGPSELQASWDKEGSLVVTVRPDRGPKRTESYIVSNDRKHLYIVLDVEGNGTRPNMKIRRAYDPAPPPVEKPAAPAASPSEGDTALA